MFAGGCPAHVPSAARHSENTLCEAGHRHCCKPQSRLVSCQTVQSANLTGLPVLYAIAVDLGHNEDHRNQVTYLESVPCFLAAGLHHA